MFKLKFYSRLPAALLLVCVTGITLSAQSFPGTKMYVVQAQKLKLVEVSFDLSDNSLVATSKGKSPETVTIPYSEISKIEYERTAHRRWKAGVLVSGVFLLSKGKKHWLAVFRGEEETVFQLSKKNYTRIIDAVEAKTGKDVKVIVRRG